ncbi:MAG: class I SAM-dependent methyltransferase [Thermoleophilaceae bacterium]
MSLPAKAGRFVSLLATHPGEFVDNLVDRGDLALERFRARSELEPRPLPDVLEAIERPLRREVAAYLAEPGLEQIGAEVDDAKRGLADGPFPAAYNADPALARLCYALTRALRPGTVVETGVAYGMTSAFIAAALERNGAGLLHSVDRPPVEAGADDYVGVLVPEALRHRHELLRGSSKRILPGLLDRVGMVELFVHDSLHTYRNIQRELRMVTPRLASPAVVVADDAVNTAFSDWAARERPAYSSAVERSGCAVAVIAAGEV